MARAGPGLGVPNLTKQAQVSTYRITRLAKGEALYLRMVDIIRTASEATGVELIKQDGGGPGVGLRASAR